MCLINQIQALCLLTNIYFIITFIYLICLEKLIFFCNHLGLIKLTIRHGRKCFYLPSHLLAPKYGLLHDLHVVFASSLLSVLQVGLLCYCFQFCYLSSPICSQAWLCNGGVWSSAEIWSEWREAVLKSFLFPIFRSTQGCLLLVDSSFENGLCVIFSSFFISWAKTIFFFF